MTGEFAFIDWLRRRTPAASRVLQAPATIRPSCAGRMGRIALVTTDMLLEGSCFRLAETHPGCSGAGTARQIGRKAMAVNLSDIAAMAGVPVAAVVSVGLPRQGGRTLAEELVPGSARDGRRLRHGHRRRRHQQLGRPARSSTSRCWARRRRAARSVAGALVPAIGCW